MYLYDENTRYTIPNTKCPISCKKYTIPNAKDRKSVKAVKAEEKEVRVDLKDMKKEKEGCLSMGASAGSPTIFTPRSFQPDVAVPTSFPLPTMSTSPPHSPYSYVWIPTPPFTPFYSSPPCGLMPEHQWLICGACHSWGNIIMS